MLRQQKLLHLKFILQLPLLQKGKVCFILPVSLKQDPHQLHLLTPVLLPRSIYQIEVSPCNGKGKKLTTIPNLLNCCLQITSLDYKQSSLIRPGRFFKKIGKAKACVMRPVVGDPFTKGVEQGPQINSGQFKKTLRCIREGRDSSAALECGDDTICSQSYFIQFKC
ncbi:uncharacterized protein [Solanum tuberosum]|uniref:uncharacterized protein isoform X2 n=1 Tax=Solanum tuberosum TaxID=4113 RepID=UPI000739F893|nr:PREDICTED: uncharacterized protein LOC102599538 isoform X2 [Solanum tuberosum]